MLKLIFTLLILPFTGYGQKSTDRHLLGEEFAKQQIQMALAGNDRKPFYDTLFNDKEAAIDFAEAILLEFTAGKI